ncbi:transcriptional regulator, deoR family [Aurantimonas manganoxydans SI85-9A1]|uniref:Transcriptional regulator, deoR family n=1 Tax=Aurantimonas manganoxydans (strain ATCC BAA-1229 / DSM 21871 / SI85-9A1) TaxID=287752 RepID=Q1YGQ8_AURMS|nr:DeoR/GlpR family DNA-binding transcription regulator [Aurantimonas manganoxydans]EAS49167.1 transcriptional regulator, deoR family [Aurantimonas manganoxydans SI85-9A1]
MQKPARQIRFPQDRHRRMAELIAARGRMTVGELIDAFGVSGPTARRDLEVLSQAGLIVRTHGGAMAPGQGGPTEPLFMEKLRTHQAAKTRIGAAAARRVEDGQRVLVDSGTTTLAAARVLAGRPVRIFAMDLKIAEAVAVGETRVSLLGGEVRNGYYSLIGEWSLRALRDLVCDLFLMSADALDPAGVSNSTPEEAAVKQGGIGCAARTILLADHSKLGTRAPVPVCGLDAIETLITDRKAAGRLDPYRSSFDRIELH